jgi:hypothetical protein
MKLRRREDAKSDPPPSGYVGDHADKLSRIPHMPHDEDERPSREDLSYGTNIFNRSPVPLPRFLTGKKRQH